MQLLTRGQFLDAPDSDTVRVQLTTDNHLGYKKNTDLNWDSFIGFEECLSVARENSCDAVLLGGDFFHHNRPCNNTVQLAMEILKHYSLSDNEQSESRLQVSGDEGVLLNGTNNLSRAVLPVFAIHGNHDNPIGDPPRSVLELQHIAEMLNYFNSMQYQTEDGSFYVRPLVLSKGGTKVNIYGLGYVMEEVFRTALTNEKVRWKLTDGMSVGMQHQNRGSDRKEHFPVSLIPDAIPIILWGHEHESIPNLVSEGGKDVLQAGSSVATSMNQSECTQKHCFIMEVKFGQARFFAVPQLSPRVLIFKQYTCTQLQDSEAHLRSVIDKCVEEATQILEQRKQLLGSNPQELGVVGRMLAQNTSWQSSVFQTTMSGNSTRSKNQLAFMQLPRIRVKVTGLKLVNIKRVQDDYREKVANYNEIVKPEAHKRAQSSDKDGVQSVVEKNSMDDEEYFLDLVQRQGTAPLKLQDARAVWNQLRSGDYKSNKGMIYSDVSSMVVKRHLEKLERDDRSRSDKGDGKTDDRKTDEDSSSTSDSDLEILPTPQKSAAMPSERLVTLPPVSSLHGEHNHQNNHQSHHHNQHNPHYHDQSYHITQQHAHNQHNPHYHDQSYHITQHPAQNQHNPHYHDQSYHITQQHAHNHHQNHPHKQQNNLQSTERRSTYHDLITGEYLDQPPPLQDYDADDDHACCYHNPNDPRNQGNYTDEEYAELMRVINKVAER